MRCGEGLSANAPSQNHRTSESRGPLSSTSVQNMHKLQLDNHEPRAILFSDSRWAWTPSTAVGCAPPRASPPRASPPRTCHLVPATSIQRRTCHLVPATSIRGADAAPRPSAMVSAMVSAVVSAISSAVASAQPLTPCTDSASTPRQMQSWGTAPRMPRRRAVVSACMQGRSSVAISVPGPRMPRRRAGAP